MRSLDIKQIPVRSLRISGLTARWGAGDSRRTSIWNDNLVAWWDTRTLPDGELATIPNAATMEGKAPDMAVEGATLEKGTLRFDGADDCAITDEYAFPARFTVFWDMDWLDKEDKAAGIIQTGNLYALNHAGKGVSWCCVRQGGTFAGIPNGSVGISSSGKYYGKSGAASDFGGTMGEGAPAGKLYVGRNSAGTVFTRMDFRQLLIFNKELSQDEVDDVLRAMFPA